MEAEARRNNNQHNQSFDVPDESTLPIETVRTLPTTQNNNVTGGDEGRRTMKNEKNNFSKFTSVMQMNKT